MSDDIVNSAPSEEERQKLLDMQLSMFPMIADDLERKVISNFIIEMEILIIFLLINREELPAASRERNNS